jgi:hypothetical protein
VNAVTIHPEMMHGIPCFTGNRVPVKALFDYLAHNHPLNEFLLDFPSVALAASRGFQVLVTSEHAIEHQQNESQLPFSIVILHPESNAIDNILPLVPKLLLCLDQVQNRR